MIDSQPDPSNVARRMRLSGIQIQTTSRCNGRCIICPYLSSWHAENPGEMADDTFCTIVDQIKAIHTKKLCPYLENEPLMDRKFFSRLELMRDNCSYDLIEVSTNALLLNNERAERLIEILREAPHEIWISFHGANKESYEELMAIPFEKTFKNVINFLKLCDSLKAPMNVKIRGAGLPKSWKWSLKRFFKKSDYQAFWQRALREHDIKIDPEIFFFRFHDRASNISTEGLNLGKKPRRTLKNLNCPRVDKWLHFLYTGELILCCMDYHRETVFGNIRNKSLTEILAEEPFGKLRGQATGAIEAPDDFICKRCFSPGG